MANIYTKSMREALQEARDYRDTSDIDEVTDIDEAKNHLEYDEWLKQVKGIKKGAHGINSDEHAKYSGEWRDYITALFNNLPPIKKESNLDEIVGGKGEMTITKDGGVMIIKTRDWQTYKAKGWEKKEEVGNESLELPATGDTITSNASQEVEGEELTEAWNEKLAIKALAEYRKVYEMLKKTGIDKNFIKSMEKFYDDLVLGGMYTSRGAEKMGILKIDGRTKYKNQNW